MNDVNASEAVHEQAGQAAADQGAAAAAHGHAAAAHGQTEGQQHPLGIYLWIWALLFVFSTFSYLVDYFQLHGMLRWSLIILFMLVKAGFIVAIFMHMRWERLALKFAILIPPLALLILIGLMAIEGLHTFITRYGAFVR
jgi:cytochrome c oxidase subunit 4